VKWSHLPTFCQHLPAFAGKYRQMLANVANMSQGASHNLLNTLYVRGGRIFDTLEHQYEPILSPFE
jgi:hypothetical protein